MKSRTGRKAMVRLAAVLIGAAVTVSVLGCSEEDRARRSLKKVLHEEVKQWNKFNQRKVKSNVFQSGGRFYKIFKERVDPMVSMRRTNSVETPYIATISFTENTFVTKRRSTSEEASRDVHFIMSNTRKTEVIYTYVSGSWKKKEIY